MAGLVCCLSASALSFQEGDVLSEIMSFYLMMNGGCTLQAGQTFSSRKGLRNRSFSDGMPKRCHIHLGVYGLALGRALLEDPETATRNGIGSE